MANRKYKMTVPQDTVDQVRELAAEGLGRKEIGKQTGISGDTVYRITRDPDYKGTDDVSCRQITRVFSAWIPGVVS